MSAPGGQYESIRFASDGERARVCTTSSHCQLYELWRRDYSTPGVCSCMSFCPCTWDSFFYSRLRGKAKLDGRWRDEAATQHQQQQQQQLRQHKQTRTSDTACVKLSRSAHGGGIGRAGARGGLARARSGSTYVVHGTSRVVVVHDDAILFAYRARLQLLAGRLVVRFRRFRCVVQVIHALLKHLSGRKA